MTTVLVTGSAGFVGRNLCLALRDLPETTVLEFDIGMEPGLLAEYAGQADAIVHLAGANRPETVEEFETVNVGLTRTVCQAAEAGGKRPILLLSSSIQAALDNPYGISKRRAEEVVREWAGRSAGSAVIYRLRNLFGRWCRPNYNSVVATFCHNISHGVPIQVNDPTRLMELTYIDDLVAEFLSRIAGRFTAAGAQDGIVSPPLEIPLGTLADYVADYRDELAAGRAPMVRAGIDARMYATYLSYLDLPSLVQPEGASGGYIPVIGTQLSLESGKVADPRPADTWSGRITVSDGGGEVALVSRRDGTQATVAAPTDGGWSVDLAPGVEVTLTTAPGAGVRAWIYSPTQQ